LEINNINSTNAYALVVLC